MFGFGNKTEYQLVVEFVDESSESFKEVSDLEMSLDAELTTGEVDGNDVGQGIINIFIITKDPAKCFAETMTYIKSKSLKPSAAGYRPVDGEDYVRLWPSDDKTPFELK
jgi:hypothetical protein